eukprot:TRINITY_DN884_c0_g1::TRINITY_DN884_c0_g1_i1::g.25361::m.25361 TRINITY_DN884_c0_g1::TRINITY_DN884_c0_g1_i1::g.25361  ORF type:complete len:253 (+),score=63.90,sp/P48496/TPIC_SPIOL/55.92/9e-97,TIM/PF00121.13/5.2e-89 TRINITY_DN884_c0_g1_i1:56-814(+)
MTRRFWVGGNWKCNGNRQSVAALVNELNAHGFDGKSEVVVFPPYVYLESARANLRKEYEVGAQDVYFKEGAFTGAVSASMIKDLGLQWTIIGHSERRSVFGDTNEIVAQKAAHALEKGLKVAACIGETLTEREQGKTFDVVREQMQAYLDKIPRERWHDMVVAYEPVWAIGTGKVATPDQAQEVHQYLREWAKKNLGEEIAATLRIAYGGSVKPDNCNELASKPDIDGFLVGGASLHGKDFNPIIASAAHSL